MRVDFYILENQSNMARFPFTCKIIEKIYQEQIKTLILCHSNAEAEELDELLWTFKEILFIPHIFSKKNLLYNYQPLIEINIVENSFDCENKIIIYFSTEETLPKLEKASRIIEVVSKESEVKQEARKHFQWFRQQGYDIKTHTISF